MEMAATAVTGMSGVQRAVVADLEPDRFQCLQAALYLFVQGHRVKPQSSSMSGSAGMAGKVLRKGLTVTLA